MVSSREHEQPRVDLTTGQPAAPRWTVRPYRPDDEAQVVHLFNEVFHKEISTAHYRRKLTESPWPLVAPNVWVAEADGRIVGHYAGTPMAFFCRDEEWTILHASDAMTAADFRREGVLTALSLTAHEAWAAAGVPFIIGLPHEGWGSRRGYLGWQGMFNMAWLWRSLRPEQLLARRLRLPAPLGWGVRVAGRLWNRTWRGALAVAARGVEVHPVGQPDPELDLLCSTVGPQYEAAVVRNQAWVDYRYHASSGYQLLMAWRAGQPVGYLAYRLTTDGGRRTGWVADLFTAPTDTAARAALLRDALVALEAAGAQDARALVPAGTALFSAFRRAGFIGNRGAYEASITSMVP